MLVCQQMNKYIQSQKIYIILLGFDYIIIKKNVQNHYKRKEMSLNREKKQPPPKKNQTKKPKKTP